MAFGIDAFGRFAFGEGQPPAVGGAVTANLTATEASDLLSSTSVLAIQAALTGTEAADALSSGASLSITAGANLTEGQDTAVAQAALAIQASASVTEALDTVVATATVGSSPINADLVATEQPDVLSATASLGLQDVLISGGGYAHLLRRPRRKKHDDDELEDEEKLPTAVRIGKATPKPEIKTGVIELPRRKKAVRNTDILENINRFRGEGERAYRDRIKRIIAADDDWLMTA